MKLPTTPVSEGAMEQDWKEQIKDPYSGSAIADAICGCVYGEWEDEKYNENAEVVTNLILQIESKAHALGVTEGRELEQAKNQKEVDMFVALVLHKVGGELTFSRAEMDTIGLDYQKKANHDGSITFKALSPLQEGK